MKILAVALALLAVGAQAQTTEKDDHAAIDAAVMKWQKSLPAGVTIGLGHERYAPSFATATLATWLEKSGATKEQISQLEASYYARNSYKHLAAPFSADAQNTRTFRVTLPAYDEGHTYALVLGASDKETIWLALVTKKSGVWQATWQREVKASSATAPPPAADDKKPEPQSRQE